MIHNGLRARVGETAGQAKQRRTQSVPKGEPFDSAQGRTVGRFARLVMASFNCAQDRLGKRVPFRSGLS